MGKPDLGQNIGKIRLVSPLSEQVATKWTDDFQNRGRVLGIVQKAVEQLGYTPEQVREIEETLWWMKPADINNLDIRNLR